MKMKKILFILSIAFVAFSCETEDPQEPDNYSGPDVAYFTSGVASSYFVTQAEEPTTIQVGATSVSSSDRTYGIEVDPESTAVQGVDFMLPSNSVTIPAGSYFGELNVQGIFAGTTADGSELILKLTGNGTPNAEYRLGIFQRCISDLAGMYSMTTTYGFHDFLPNFSTNTIDVEIVEVEPGLYFVSDFSGGLYSDGPYTTAYGTDDTSIDVEFSENCGLISWEGQVDPWGDVIPQDNSVNSVDANGVITINWFCTGYGENGVSVYTPL